MTDGSQTPDIVEIGLDASEAVVLFELLSRWCDPKTQATPSSGCFQSTAECAVLLGLLGSLEKQLAAPFKPDYGEIVAQARRDLEPLWDHATLNGRTPGYPI
ncbi:hypothetical protein J8I29_14865 [Labrys sp. LIt4]|uniref:hypothetical protein n=1 Tax=Labrys sp. LIt4 TaxID=2821355 RepID=UPI001AE0CC08|nr:hypothetical protein [Labrys sp. LIt4]MBP0580604.1 hypothetical protein [Labrys sp. LIt4]